MRLSAAAQPQALAVVEGSLQPDTALKLTASAARPLVLDLCPAHAESTAFVLAP